MEYVPLIISLLSALVGIRGYTWDDKNNRITRFGKIIILLSLFSFATAFYTIKIKNHQISDTNSIRKIAYGQIKLGIERMLTPLEFGSAVKDSIINFAVLEDTVHLSELFRTSVLNPFKGLIIAGGFDNNYQRDSALIQEGENLLNDVIIKYNKYLDAETIVYINNIISDSYFNRKFKLKESSWLIQRAVATQNDSTLSLDKRLHPAFSTYGAYYSTGDINGHHKYNGILSLIKKVKMLSNHIKN